MSPKTTPSAAKLKPAAPIAEAGLRFSAEILITRISMDHSIQPRDRAAEQRDELAALHCPMPPVLPTERIAHLGAGSVHRLASLRPPSRGTAPIRRAHKGHGDHQLSEVTRKRPLLKHVDRRRRCVGCAPAPAPSGRA